MHIDTKTRLESRSHEVKSPWV